MHGVLRLLTLENGVELLEDQIPDLHRRQPAVGAAAALGDDLIEDERVQQGAPADHDTVTAGFSLHAIRILNGADIAVADHRNLNTFPDLADDAPVRTTPKTLRPAAGMHGDGRSPAGFRQARHGPGGAFLMLPAGPDLHREGHLDRLLHARQQVLGPVGITHQRRAGVSLDDFAHRTAHVHIHEIGPGRFRHGRRLRHALRIATDELDRERALVLPQLHLAQFLVLPAGQCLGGDHLGDDEATGTQVANHAAKIRIGQTGKGRHDQVGADFPVGHFQRAPRKLLGSAESPHCPPPS